MTKSTSTIDVDVDALARWHAWADSASHPIILDGGLGELVQKRGNDILTGSLWSGQLIKSKPQVFKDVAMEWLNAGAEIICTATYQVTTDLLASEFNISHQEAQDHIRRHCQDMRDVAKNHAITCKDLPGRHPIAALSIGPFSSISPDFNEFSSDYTESITREFLASFHGARLSSFTTSDNSPMSLVVFETIGATREAMAVIDAMETHLPSLPFWISFQCKNGTQLANGDDLKETIRTVLGRCNHHLVALGINCVCVSTITGFTDILNTEIDQWMNEQERIADRWNVRVLTYPNSGEVWSNRSWVWKKDSNVTAPLIEDDWAHTVVSTKATIVGGCCRTGPQHIAALRKVLLNN